MHQKPAVKRSFDAQKILHVETHCISAEIRPKKSYFTWEICKMRLFFCPFFQILRRIFAGSRLMGSHKRKKIP